MLGDKVVSPATAALFSDEELDALLLDAGDDVNRAAVAAAESLIADFSALPDSMSVGDTSLTVGQMVERWTANLGRFRRAVGGMPFTGGISVSDRDARAANADGVSPYFSRG